MTILLTILYFAVCLFLIVVVLLQHGKADIGVALGAGASNTVFGARGAGNFLTKLTTASAVLFMVLAFTLARFSTDTGAEDLLEVPASEAPTAPESAAPPTQEPSAPPSEPGGAPSGFESIEVPPAPATAPPAEPPAPEAPAQAPK